MNDKNKYPYAEYRKGKYPIVIVSQDEAWAISAESASRLYKSLGVAIARYIESDNGEE